jgi:hypothetical protein
MQTHRNLPEVYGAEHRRISLTSRNLATVELDRCRREPARRGRLDSFATYCLSACAAAFALAFAAS